MVLNAYSVKYHMSNIETVYIIGKIIYDKD